MTKEAPVLHCEPDGCGPDTLRDELTFYRELVNELVRKNDTQKILNEVLRISLQPGSLTEQLDAILRLILSIEWLTLEKKGGFFLKLPNRDTLKLVSHQNLDHDLLKMCDRVAFGHCLCGRAALDRKLLFKPCLDHDHENRPGNIADHGHYVVPIVNNDSLLGILTLYVKCDHIQTEEEIGFLTACSHVIAGVIIRKTMEDDLVHLSTHDPLTQFPNRRALYHHIRETIKRLKRAGGQLALIFVDLDHFKIVNDTHGHQIGDEILVNASIRIKESLRESDFVARLGGDEFVAVLECNRSTDGEMLRQTAERLVESVSRPYIIGGEHVRIGASVGIYVHSPDDDQEADAQMLITKADQAMYQAKITRGTVHILSEDRRPTRIGRPKHTAQPDL